MRRRDRPGLDDRRELGALLVVQDRGPPRCPARRQAIRAALVKPQDPVADDLQCVARNLRRCAPAPSVQDQGNR